MITRGTPIYGNLHVGMLTLNPIKIAVLLHIGCFMHFQTMWVLLLFQYVPIAACYFTPLLQNMVV